MSTATRSGTAAATGDRITPRATYRLQLTAAFGFEEAAALVPYLAELGVSHLYLSPALQSAPGSEHGYDVADPTVMDAGRGGEAGFERLCSAVRGAGLGLVLDVVPNHMVADPQANPWWRDVLANGRDSAYADHFDIDWEDPRAQSKVVLPILGETLDEAIGSGAVRAVVVEGRLMIAAHETLLPLAEGSAASFGQGLAPDAVAETLRDDAAALQALLARQHWQLAFWRRGLRRLTYRRFFDITELVGVRVEDEGVFAERHARILAAVRDGVVDGLRIDHPDGLADPEEYLQRLRVAAPRTWIVVEKILEGEERLPSTWPVDGTTGYDFASRLTRLFVDPQAADALRALHARIIDREETFEALLRRSKQQVVHELLIPEMARLGRLFQRVVAALGAALDRERLDRALAETVIAMPVYRTYVRPGTPVSPADAHHLDIAMARARAAGADPEALNLLQRCLCGEVTAEPAAELCSRFQQVTGSAMAKGLEDTAFYRDFTLTCLNEVGADPATFACSPSEFHAFCQRQQQSWPATMTAGTTHDTKRSADVRIRIAALSECPARWADAVEEWNRRAAGHRRSEWPDPAMQYLLWQTLVGCWPVDVERVGGYMEKAAREAKEHTSWLEPNEDYEQAVQDFVRAVLSDRELTAEIGRFVDDVVTPIAHVHSLSAMLLQLTAPGVPDVYQGDEMFALSLTDPDNRRPVDFEQRRRLLDELSGATVDRVLARRDEGLAKLWVVRTALAARRAHPGAFGRQGSYRPLRAEGTEADRVVGFVRGEAMATVVPRLTGGVREGWRDTVIQLGDGRWRDAFSGEVHGGRVEVSRLWQRFPVALLARM